MDDHRTSSSSSSSSAALAAAPADHGWQTVTYPKRGKNQPKPPLPSSSSSINGVHNNFTSIDQKANVRADGFVSARATAAAADAAAAAGAIRSRGSDDEDDDSGAEVPNGEVEPVKKVKVKKPKKVKITVAEAASKIDAADLAVFLDDVSTSYETQQDIQLMRFADFFGRALSSVSASQFPWAKMFSESPVAKMADIPICHISDSVHKTSADWIAQKSPEALSDFVMWGLDGIFDDVASQASAKGSKKPVQHIPAKAQVAIFLVLAMILRRKPEIIINLLSKLKDPKYQGQEKLPIIVWVIAQGCQGDLAVGMYAWAHFLLPLVLEKSTVNPQARDILLQLVERILSVPKARPILLNCAVRKGERLVPPSAYVLLMRVAFPAPAARVKATERFEAIYPTLKELALAGSPGTKTTKQASQQLLPYVVKAMQENNPDLTKEAIDAFIWCLTQNPECYRQWENLHLENLDASVAVLQKLSNQWKEYSPKLGSLGSLRDTLKHLREKNEEALSGNAGDLTSIRDADKYCKALLGRLNRGSSCIKTGVCILGVAIALGFFVSPNMESLEKLHPIFGSLLTV